MMHDSMQFDPIQGQGHEPLTVGNTAIFDRQSRKGLIFIFFGLPMYGSLFWNK